MKELLIYLISISTFVIGGEHCETIKNGIVEKYTIAYTQSNDKIIRVCKKKEFTVETAIHELGHIFYWHILTKEEKLEWQNLHNESLKNSGTLWKRGFVNFEATENDLEDFAETFSFIYFNKKDIEKTLFIKNLIKKKVEELKLKRE